MERGQGERARTEPHLDVQENSPARSHRLIFETFDALKSIDAFILVNDHDPKPPYYQFQAERTGQLTRDYLEQGPEV